MIERIEFLVSLLTSIFLKSDMKISDVIDIFGVIVTVIFSFATIFVAVLAYKISANTEKREKKKYDDAILKSVSMTYDYLLELLNKFKHTFAYGSKAYESISYESVYGEYLVDLNSNILDQQEVKYIRELYDYVKRYCDGKKGSTIYDDLQVKWIYKKIFDLNVCTDDIKKDYEHEKIEFLASLKILVIICKLKKVLNILEEYEEYKCDAQIIKIKDNGSKIYIEKNYRSNFSISTKNGISGNIKQYETIFIFGDPSTKLLADIIYEGNIENNEFNGEGRYYYYSKDLFKPKDKINSFDLIKDKCAMQIKNELKKSNLETNIRATFSGIFKDGKMYSGKLEYETIDKKGILNIT